MISSTNLFFSSYIYSTFAYCIHFHFSLFIILQKTREDDTARHAIWSTNKSPFFPCVNTFSFLILTINLNDLSPNVLLDLSASFFLFSVRSFLLLLSPSLCLYYSMSHLMISRTHSWWLCPIEFAWHMSLCNGYYSVRSSNSQSYAERANYSPSLSLKIVVMD